MSFQDKDFWIAKDIEHLNDGDAAFNNPSTIDSKRPNQWIVDSTESELFSNKKQAVQSLDSNLTPSEVPNLSIPLWDNTSTFHQVPNQFIDRLFGTGTARSVNFSENSISPVGDDSMNLRIKHIDEQFGNDPSEGLSISHASEDPEIFLSYGGIRKVKVNQVKGPSSNKYVHSPKQHSCNKEAASLISRGPASLSLLGHTYSNSGDSYVKSVGPAFNKRDDDTLPMDHSYAGDNSTISFSCFHDDPSIPLSGLSGSYDFLTNQSSVQMSEMSSEKELHSPEANAVARPARNAKSGPDSKKKPEPKVSKKEAPNSFPSNVKSLLSTGMLDGVPVKYVSLQRQELRGIIKGSGYLCGCKSCNFSKALNAYEFERHANCKSKHPNNHIYFENGKTIYQIVQELKGTPESKLFDTIQTVFGAPINQKAFRIWKESFQAATRELQRIYGKDELNL